MRDEKSARLVWRGENLDFDARLGSGYEFTMGGPAGVHGGSPMEFFLAAVAGCTAMDIVHVLRKKRQPFTGLEVTISGARVDDHPRVYDAANIHYTVHGAGVDSRAVERAIELSQTRYCSASIMFKRGGARVTTSYSLAPETAPAAG